MKIIIKEHSNHNWVLQELQIAYQAKTREVDTWKKAREALIASNKFAEITFQSELSVVKIKAKD